MGRAQPRCHSGLNGFGGQSDLWRQEAGPHGGEQRSATGDGLLRGASPHRHLSQCGDERREERVALADRFIKLSAERGVLSVLEPVVRATAAEGSAWDADAAIREAARELSALRPDLYKSQVPMAGAGDEKQQRAASAALNECMTGPWVVLSQGVERDRFEPAVRAACLEGASGFLAGRALWSDVVGAEDVRAQLRERSAPRLRSLIDTVEAVGRPWSAR